MPRNANGDYELPAGNPVVSGTVIDADNWCNPTMGDVSDALTDSLSRTGKGAMQAALKLIAGDLGNPGLTFEGDEDTGLYLNGANQLGITAGGVARLLTTQISGVDLIRFLVSPVVRNGFPIRMEPAVGTFAKTFTLGINGTDQMVLGRVNNAGTGTTTIAFVSDSDDPIWSFAREVAMRKGNPMYWTADADINDNGNFRIVGSSGTASFRIEERVVGVWETLIDASNTGISFGAPVSFSALTLGDLTVNNLLETVNYEQTGYAKLTGGGTGASEQNGVMFSPSTLIPNASPTLSGSFRIATRNIGGGNYGLSIYRATAGGWEEALRVSNNSGDVLKFTAEIGPNSLVRKSYVDGLVSDVTTVGDNHYIIVGTGTNKMVFQWGDYPTPPTDNDPVTITFPVAFDANGGQPPAFGGALGIFNPPNNQVDGFFVNAFLTNVSLEYTGVQVESKTRGSTNGSVTARTGTWFAFGKAA